MTKDNVIVFPTDRIVNKEKVIKMGQAQEKVFMIGPMALDEILNANLISKKEFTSFTFKYIYILLE